MRQDHSSEKASFHYPVLLSTEASAKKKLKNHFLCYFDFRFQVSKILCHVQELFNCHNLCCTSLSWVWLGWSSFSHRCPHTAVLCIGTYKCVGDTPEFWLLLSSSAQHQRCLSIIPPSHQQPGTEPSLGRGHNQDS